MHKIDGAGHLDNTFVNEDAATGRAPTVVTPEWLNAVQGELVSLLEAAGIAPTKASNSQLVQALRAAGVFASPPQFDKTTKVATTEFVQQALGNFANNRPRSINEVVTLTGADSGTCFELGSSASVTLPMCSSVPVGTVFIFTTSPAVTTATVNRQGASDTLAINNGGAYTSYTMGSGSDIMFINDGMIWRGNFGKETLRTNSVLFASSKTANGYQKLPSGLIFQWGSTGGVGSPNITASFPIQFPTACLHVIPFYEGGSAASSGIVSFSTSQVVIQLSGGTPAYFAIGH